MANVQAGGQVAANAPTTFLELFRTMDDVYNGVYAPFFAQYSPANAITAGDLMQLTVTRFPADQVPAVFVYQDMHSTIRIMHHPHIVTCPFGQPATPLTNAILGFYDEVRHGTAQVIQLPSDSFFASTGEVVVPTSSTMMALLAVVQPCTLCTGIIC